VNAAAEGAPILDAFRKEKNIAALITRVDDVYAERSAQLALEYTTDGGSRGWSNPDTGTTGTIRPTRTFQQADGTYCREYAHAIQVRQKSGGDVKAQAEAAGRFACRQPSARWKFLP
jgi:surface antigen